MYNEGNYKNKANVVWICLAKSDKISKGSDRKIKPLGRRRLRWEYYVKKFVKSIDPRTNWRRNHKTEREEGNLFCGMVLKTGKPPKESNTLR